ncbi:MAG: FAD-binding protein [Gammaproteobacteria bacterium]|nr:FAD-binding protein [Gammaproteobacteria bacterium]
MNANIIKDISGIGTYSPLAVSTPHNIEELASIIKNSQGQISIGGGRFSMGGQIALNDGLHLDMRQMNRVLNFDPVGKTIRVETGIRWCDIQKFVDPHDLSVKIMQTYANFTVGGSLSVNVHGRYMGLGPLVLSVKEITLVTAQGDILIASPQENADVFYSAIGGYGGIGVIAEATLELADNVKVERHTKKMPVSAYLDFFKKLKHQEKQPIFHNADIYPPHYKKLRAVTWTETSKAVTNSERLKPIREKYLFEKYFFWMVSEMPFGKWRREHLVDPLFYSLKKVHWRNYEAGYDVAELEPLSRDKRNYALQEYFIPVDKFESFADKMRLILQKHKANVVNVSVRHAVADPGTKLAWAREEVFAFVLYHKFRTRDNALERVSVWTRELIQAAIEENGSYYLPYQILGTNQQFKAAYPKHEEFFAIKQKYDPENRFSNQLWEKYYLSDDLNLQNDITESEFKYIYSNTEGRDDFYKFLQNVFNLYPEDRFQSLIINAMKEHQTDDEIYRYIQTRLPSIKPKLGDLTYALPALKKQKQEMSKQTLELLGDIAAVNGCLEIGSTGRYFSDFKKHVKCDGDFYYMHEHPQSLSPVDMIERGGFRKFGRYLPLNDYEPVSREQIATESLEMVTCFIGLHHCEPSKLQPFVQSLVRVLKPGGYFILRDHAVDSDYMDKMACLAHTVFNSGIGEPWNINAEEPRYFNTLEHWSQQLEQCGLKDSGQRLYQEGDPTLNALMLFTKEL